MGTEEGGDQVRIAGVPGNRTSKGHRDTARRCGTRDPPGRPRHDRGPLRGWEWALWRLPIMREHPLHPESRGSTESSAGGFGDALLVRGLGKQLEGVPPTPPGGSKPRRTGGKGASSEMQFQDRCPNSWSCGPAGCHRHPGPHLVHGGLGVLSTQGTGLEGDSSQRQERDRQHWREGCLPLSSDSGTQTWADLQRSGSRAGDGQGWSLLSHSRVPGWGGRVWKGLGRGFQEAAEQELVSPAGCQLQGRPAGPG